MAEGTSAGVFCPNPFIKYSYTLNDNCNVFLMLRYLIEMHGLVENLLWKLWKFTQTKVPRWMKAPVIMYSVLIHCFNALISLMRTAAFLADILVIRKADERVKEL